MLTTTPWIVVLEVVRGPGATHVGVEMLTNLLELLRRAEPDGAHPLALLTDDRYALHLSVRADDLGQALLIAVLRWKEVSRQLGLGGWNARRAEVITRVDFEMEAQPLADSIWRVTEG